MYINKTYTVFDFLIYDLQDFQDELILIVSGTFIQILSAIDNMALAPYLPFSISGVKFFSIWYISEIFLIKHT